MSVDVETKMIHAAAMKVFCDFDTQFLDVRKDIENVLQLERARESKVKHH